MIKKNKSLKINALLSVINSFLTMGFSLLTYPYVARILQAENLGKVNYANSIVSYFALIAVLGFSTYAIREGSRLRENKEKINRFSSEIFTLNLYTVVIAYVLLILAVALVSRLKPFMGLILLQSITIFSTWISLNWINVIYEDYLSITLRSVAIRIVSLILLFILVNDSQDYYIYQAILVFSTLVVDLMNYIYIHKYVKVKIVRCTNYKKHFPPVMVFFSNAIAVNIYLNSDITMLGWISGSDAVGYYSAAVRVYSAIKTIVATVYNTAIPRMSLYANYDDKTNFKELLNKIINIIIFIAIPATVMLFVTSKYIIYIIAGKSFEIATQPLKILSLAFLFAVIGGALAYCVCVPLKMEKNVLYATLVAAVENVVLNIVLIPIFGISGTALTTLLAEFTVFVILAVSIVKHNENMFNTTFIITNIFKTGLGVLLIIITKYSLGLFLKGNWIIEILLFYVIGFAVFLLSQLVLKNDCCILILGKLLKKINKEQVYK